MPFILFDIAILLVLGFFIWRGASRGFILTFLGLIALVVAFVGANFLSDLLAPKVGAALEPKFAAVIEEKLNEQFKDVDTPALPEGTDATGVLGLLKSMGLYDKLGSAVKDAVDAGKTEVAAAAAAAVAAALAISVARAVLFPVFFLLILLAWTLLSHALNLVAKLPGLDTVNKTAGGIVGFLKGCILLFIAAWILRLIGNLIPEDIVQQTILLKFFMMADPFKLIAGLWMFTRK